MPNLDEGHEETDKLLERLQKRIAKEYRRATKEIQEKLDEYLAQFAEQDKRERAKLNAGLITEQEYKDWRWRKIMIGVRWSEMRGTLAADYSNTNMIARSMVYAHIPEVYAVNHNYATFQVERDSLVDTSYSLYDRQTVERIIRDEPQLMPPPSKSKAEQIAKNKDMQWNKKQIDSAVLQGILQGEAIPDISSRLQLVTDANKSATIRYARTMTTNAECAGRQKAYERAAQMGIEQEKEWQATLDSATRHTHRLLHGQRQPLDKPFEVNGDKIMYPGDSTAKGYLVWNCRCTMISQIKGFEIETVKTSPGLGKMTFEEWQKTKPNYRELKKKREENSKLTEV